MFRLPLVHAPPKFAPTYNPDQLYGGTATGAGSAFVGTSAACAATVMPIAASAALPRRKPFTARPPRPSRFLLPPFKYKRVSLAVTCGAQGIGNVCAGPNLVFKCRLYAAFISPSNSDVFEDAARCLSDIRAASIRVAYDPKGISGTVFVISL